MQCTLSPPFCGGENNPTDTSDSTDKTRGKEGKQLGSEKNNLKGPLEPNNNDSISICINICTYQKVISLAL